MSTIIDQAEVDAVLAGAHAAEPASSPGAAALVPQRSDPPLATSLARLLRLKVPVIAELSRRRVLMARARRLATGMILEFDRGIEEHCRVMINNQLIATGEVVRVGDHFGLRILAVEDARSRIQSLGR